MKPRARVFYLGMITTDAYGAAIGERLYAGAAVRKMTLVARAMRSVGLRALVVSLPFVGTGAHRARFSPVVTREGGVPVVFTATRRSTVLRKLIGPVHLAGFFLRHARRGDTVICYNHAVEYIPALLALRFRGIRLVQDIEDAPTDEETGLRGVLNQVSFAITSRLTRPRKMVVADHVAHLLGLEEFVTIRGVAAPETGGPPAQDRAKWEALQAGGPLRLHYGGILMTETGIDLFCDAVERLVEDADRLGARVSFEVTGIGELDKIRELQARIGTGGTVTVALLPELNKADYLALLDACHGSLSLKRPGSAMSNTTFPSKVIEITAAGLALVSARLGDVPEIFVEGTAYFLDAYRPEDLVETIVDMAADPARVERVAAAGRDLCAQVFAPEAVGADMKRLITDD